MVSYGLSRDRYLELIESEAAAFASVVNSTDLRTPVPSCPGWNLAELATHLGRVHRWSVHKITGQDTHGEVPTDPDQLRAWSVSSARLLIDALTAADPDARVWTFIDDGTVMFWFRRQAVELAVHRWDAEGAQFALDGPGLIDAELSADGLAEIVETFYPRQLAQSKTEALTAAIEFTFTDIDRPPVVIGPTDRAPGATLSGPAEVLLLAAWRRVGLDHADLVTDGDPTLIEGLLAADIVP